MPRITFDFKTIVQICLLGLLLLGSSTFAATNTQSAPLEDQKSGTALSPGTVEGRVVDALSGIPIPGARVEVPEFDLTTWTDNQGDFRFTDIRIDKVAQPSQVIVTATAYGRWEIADVWFVSGDTLILNVELKTTPQKIVVPPPKAQRTDWSSPTVVADRLPAAISDQMELPLPDTITIRVSGSPYCYPWNSYELETVDFKEYVRHVLPNEWLIVEDGEMIGYWESMRAGAIAVKMYAWYWIAQGGKWDDADVWDSTCDQVYNPAVEYASSNAVIDYTWNWRLTRDGELVETNYRAYHSQCPNPDSCMGQIDADQMAASGALWNEIIDTFYLDTLLTPIQPPLIAGSMLRYFGNGYGLYDRVRIRIDNPNDSNPGPPVDVGAEDFTIELWVRAALDENLAPAIACGNNQNWIYGNVFLDRERRGGDRHFGMSIAGGKLAFGVTGQDFGGGAGQLTLCGNSNIGDGYWHHIAVQRRLSDGYLWVFVDGLLEASGDGPEGDISYPDDAAPADSEDPYLVIGAGKRDDQPSIHPPFSGWIDEIHVSGILRYSANFSPQASPFSADASTLALYHFDELLGNDIQDSSGAVGGPSNGDRRYGGGINGPDWFFSDLYMFQFAYLPYMNQP